MVKPSYRIHYYSPSFTLASPSSCAIRLQYVVKYSNADQFTRFLGWTWTRTKRS